MVKRALLIALVGSGCVVFDSYDWDPQSSTALPSSFGTTQRPEADDPCRAAARALCSDDGSVRLSCASGFPEVEVCPNGCVDGRCRDLCIREGDIECNEARTEVTTCGTAFVSSRLAGCTDGDTCALGACRPLDETCDATQPWSCNASSDELRLCDPLGGAVEVQVRCAEGVSCVELFQDWDGDGIGSARVTVCGQPNGVAEDFNLVVRSGDCDDTNAEINPDATEIPGDEIDQNCDGSEECFRNSDGDGYRSEFLSTILSDDVDCADEGEAPASLPGGDCDDTREDISPGATEIPADGVDQNCDEREDCFVDADGDGVAGPEPAPAPSTICDPELGFGPEAEIPDCDDTRADVFPTAIEVAGDGVDQDCDERELCVLDEDDDGVPEGWPPVASEDLSCAESDGIFEANVWDCDPESGDQECDEGIGWVLIPAVPSRLGSTPADRFHQERTEPERDVTFTNPFALSATEVTQTQWLEVFAVNPSQEFSCAECPVERVNWYETLAYANERSEMAGLTPCYELTCEGTPGDTLFTCSEVSFVGVLCDGYRLPTDAEWEHAARAGTTTQIYSGDVETESGSNEGTAELEEIAVLGATSEPVGSLEPNAWGVFDMSGNVSEWTFDGFVSSPPEGGEDPLVSSGGNRTVRGGGFDATLGQLRSASRTFAPPSAVQGNRGFRLARTIIRAE